MVLIKVNSPNVEYVNDDVVSKFSYENTTVVTKEDVNSPNVEYVNDDVVSKFSYENTTVVTKEDGSIEATPTSTEYVFKTNTKVPKMGLMLVGWGGNNGSTLTASIHANRANMEWKTREGTQESNYFGSLMMASTTKLGCDAKGKDVFIPFHDLVPMVHPNDMVLGGWDINNANLAEAMERACVLEPDLQRQLYPQMKEMTPLPSVYYPDYIAANQEERANNVIKGTKKEHLEQIRKDIRDFKAANNLDSIVVVWTANTERFSSLVEGVNDTAENILKAIDDGAEEVAPSTIFAVACILEKTPFINGSPQNTFVGGVQELANIHRVHIGGDDFKSGQTKMKSVLVDFMVNAGIKPIAITSYNHLGNNDGKNLSAPQQFRSKEISKSNVVDDMVESNQILYKEGEHPDHVVVIKYVPNVGDKGEHPDHVVVIKYVPNVGDSKRALDEYVSEIFMGGKSTISMHNTCEDSLLASPLIIDLAIMTELMTRVSFKTNDMEDFDTFNPVLSLLSYMLKAPLVPKGTPVVNALGAQRNAIENIFRAFIGLRPRNDMMLEHKAFH
eukprot:Awhi_evm1s10526